MVLCFAIQLDSMNWLFYNTRINRKWGQRKADHNKSPFNTRKKRTHETEETHIIEEAQETCTPRIYMYTSTTCPFPYALIILYPPYESRGDSPYQSIKVNFLKSIQIEVDVDSY